MNTNNRQIIVGYDIDGNMKCLIYNDVLCIIDNLTLLDQELALKTIDNLLPGLDSLRTKIKEIKKHLRSAEIDDQIFIQNLKQQLEEKCIVKDENVIYAMGKNLSTIKIEKENSFLKLIIKNDQNTIITNISTSEIDVEHINKKTRDYLLSNIETKNNKQRIRK